MGLNVDVHSVVLVFHSYRVYEVTIVYINLLLLYIICIAIQGNNSIHKPPSTVHNMYSYTG